MSPSVPAVALNCRVKFIAPAESYIKTEFTGGEEVEEEVVARSRKTL